MVVANPLWRAPRIHGERKLLGIALSERTVSRIRRGLRRPPTQTWKTFLHNLAVDKTVSSCEISNLRGRIPYGQRIRSV
jgi:hypothetical protein